MRTTALLVAAAFFGGCDHDSPTPSEEALELTGRHAIGAVVDGRVVDGDGQPLDSATVVIIPVGGLGPPFARFGGCEGLPTSSRVVLTDAEGRFADDLLFFVSPGWGEGPICLVMLVAPREAEAEELHVETVHGSLGRLVDAVEPSDTIRVVIRIGAG